MIAETCIRSKSIVEAHFACGFECVQRSCFRLRSVVYRVLTKMMNIGDEEGGIEMNTSIVMMKEFCKIFKGEATTTRIVSILQPTNYTSHSYVSIQDGPMMRV